MSCSFISSRCAALTSNLAASHTRIKVLICFRIVLTDLVIAGESSSSSSNVRVHLPWDSEGARGRRGGSPPYLRGGEK